MKQDGTVTEALPNTTFKVKLHENDKEIMCYLAGRMKKNFIRVIIGDIVTVNIEPKGDIHRIVARK